MMCNVRFYSTAYQIPLPFTFAYRDFPGGLSEHVLGAFTALGRSPVNTLNRALDVTKCKRCQAAVLSYQVLQ